MDSLYEKDDAFIRMMFMGHNTGKKLTKHAEAELVARYQQDRCQDAARALVMAFLPWIVSQTKLTMRRFKRTTLDLEDAVHAGVEGFLVGVDKWDEVHDARLSTFVAAYMMAAVSSCDRHVHGMAHSQGHGWRRIAWREAWLLESPSEGEPGCAEAHARIAAHLGADAREVADVSRFVHIQAEEDGLLEEQVPASRRTKLCPQARPLLERAVRAASQGMSDRQSAVWPDVLTRLLSHKPQTLEEISVQHGVSKERIRQVETVLLNKLRKAIVAEGYTRMEQLIDTPHDSHTLPIGFAV